MDDLTISRYYHLGPNSIVQTLPQPNVSMICNQPYVSLRQCIVNLLGKGNYPQGIAYESLDVQRYFLDRKIARDVYQRAVIRNRSTRIEDLIIIFDVQ